VNAGAGRDLFSPLSEKALRIQIGPAGSETALL
jgi:hypothetical protein